MVVALIPARGGSKRLPRKNIRPFGGRPLIQYSIDAALAVNRIDQCVVSTDDPDIADVARRCGATVVDRPAELSGDLATTASVAVHALRQLAAGGPAPEVMVLLQPNCPLRPRSMITDALDLLSDDVDSVITVTPHQHKVGTVVNRQFVPEYTTGMRSQDLPVRFFENGLVYVSWSRTVLESGSVFGARMRPLVTDPLYALGDIDTELDFVVAEFLLERYRSHFDWLAPQGAGGQGDGDVAAAAGPPLEPGQ